MKVAAGEQTTILPILEKGAAYLAEKGFESPRLTSELLLAHVLRCSRIDLYLRFDEPLMERELTAYRELFRRRLGHEPLQYITGETEFMGLAFTVDRRALVPRPETEHLVEEAIAIGKREPVGRILDIGTGSGNIAVALAKFIPDASVDSLDISGEALALARINVARHGVEGRVRLIKGDFLRGEAGCQPPYDLVVSNPPYVSTAEFALLPPEVKEFEPRMATTDEGDGLAFYRRIAAAGAKLLRPAGWLLLEVAYDQAAAVIGLLDGYAARGTVKDYGGIDRVVKACRA